MNYWHDDYLESLTESEPFGGYKLREADAKNTAAETGTAQSKENNKEDNRPQKAGPSDVVDFIDSTIKEGPIVLIISESKICKKINCRENDMNWYPYVPPKIPTGKLYDWTAFIKHERKESQELTEITLNNKKVKLIPPLCYFYATKSNNPSAENLQATLLKLGYRRGEKMTSDSWKTVNMELTGNTNKKGFGSEIAGSMSQALGAEKQLSWIGNTVK